MSNSLYKHVLRVYMYIIYELLLLILVAELQSVGACICVNVEPRDWVVCAEKRVLYGCNVYCGRVEWFVRAVTEDYCVCLL